MYAKERLKAEIVRDVLEKSNKAIQSKRTCAKSGTGKISIYSDGMLVI